MVFDGSEKRPRASLGAELQSRLHGGPRRDLLDRSQGFARPRDRGPARLHGRCLRGPRAGARRSPARRRLASPAESPRGPRVHRGGRLRRPRGRGLSPKGRRGEIREDADSAGPIRGARELLVAYPWSLEGTTLFPGEYVEYFVEVKDNNVVTGPGVAKSPVYRIMVPTMAELYARSEAEGEREDRHRRRGHQGRERISRKSSTSSNAR